MYVLSWGHWYPCFRFLVTSPLGFKARVGSILFAFCRGECNVHSPRSTSGATCADLSAAGIAAGHFPTYISTGGTWDSDSNGQSPGQKKNALPLCSSILVNLDLLKASVRLRPRNYEHRIDTWHNKSSSKLKEEEFTFHLHITNPSFTKKSDVSNARDNNNWWDSQLIAPELGWLLCWQPLQKPLYSCQLKRCYGSRPPITLIVAEDNAIMKIFTFLWILLSHY